MMEKFSSKLYLVSFSALVLFGTGSQAVETTPQLDSSTNQEISSFYNQAKIDKVTPSTRALQDNSEGKDSQYEKKESTTTPPTELSGSVPTKTPVDQKKVPDEKGVVPDNNRPLA